jgi:SNF2 family DNA or RNA helicase
VTGTPIQNSLDDVWSLFTLACSTKLLGEVEEFNLDYRNPVHQGLVRCAMSILLIVFPCSASFVFAVVGSTSHQVFSSLAGLL